LTTCLKFWLIVLFALLSGILVALQMEQERTKQLEIQRDVELARERAEQTAIQRLNMEMSRSGGKSPFSGSASARLGALIASSRSEGESVTEVPAGTPLPGYFKKLSVIATRRSARVFKSSASSKACFSRMPNGAIIESAFTSASLPAALMPFQSHVDWLKTAASLRHLSEMAERIKQLEQQIAAIKAEK